MKLAKLLIILLLAACPLAARAQMQIGNLFGGMGGKDDGKSGPTTIRFDEMDADDAKNIVTFTGNVVVDNSQMNIRCHKMTVHLTDLKKDTAAPKKDGEAAAGRDKDVSKIICLGDVVITRKEADKEAEAKVTQRATAGKADYDTKTGKIILSENPVLMRGDDNTLKGEFITIYRDDSRMEVKGPGELKINSSSESEAAKPAPPKQESKTDNAESKKQ